MRHERQRPAHRNVRLLDGTTEDVEMTTGELLDLNAGTINTVVRFEPDEPEPKAA